MNKESRLLYYLGENERVDISLVNKVFNRDELFLYNVNMRIKTPGSYVRDIKKIIDRNGFDVNEYYPVVFGDKIPHADIFFFCKARSLKNKSGSLIRLNKNRHWDELKAFKDNMPFDEKINSIVWRGAATGYGHPMNIPRFVFVKNYFNKFNIGFTKITKKRDGLGWEKYLLQPLSIEEQLRFKYIIVIEGNDVATSLKWVLMSNSIPFMQPPTKETWLMEGLLKPFVHYIPLNKDFSDLEEKVKWANENSDKVLDIAKNGTLFMQMFEDEEAECWIEDAVMKNYIQKLRAIES